MPTAHSLLPSGPWISNHEGWILVGFANGIKSSDMWIIYIIHNILQYVYIYILYIYIFEFLLEILHCYFEDVHHLLSGL